MLLADLSHFDDGSRISDAGLWVVRFLVALVRLRICGVVCVCVCVCVYVMVYCDLVRCDMSIAPASGRDSTPPFTLGCIDQSITRSNN